MKECACTTYKEPRGNYFVFCKCCKRWIPIKVPDYIPKEQGRKYASALAEKVTGYPHTYMQRKNRVLKRRKVRSV